MASILVNRKMTKASNGMYCLILAGLKVSLGAFFLKIFSHKRVQKLVIYALVGLTVACAVVYFCFAIITCAQLKTPPIERGRCEWQNPYNIVFYIFSVLNIAGDFILAGTGIAALWTAKLPVYTKIPACILLSMGCMSAIAAIIRFILLVQPSDQRKFTEQSLAVGQWTLVEQGSGVVAANLLMLRPLLSAFLKKIRVVSTVGHRSHGTKESDFRLQDLHSVTRPQVAYTHDEGHLLNDITKEMTFRVDEEKGSTRETYSHSSTQSMRPHRL
ncbi:Hypothetical protein D9617_9g024990 [Elsinoe fawcettii]|nr:Hypothetical protein D9617_9g024990 [Elsinoe fawcettii]